MPLCREGRFSASNMEVLRIRVMSLPIVHYRHSAPSSIIKTGLNTYLNDYKSRHASNDLFLIYLHCVLGQISLSAEVIRMNGNEALSEDRKEDRWRDIRFDYPIYCQSSRCAAYVGAWERSLGHGESESTEVRSSIAIHPYGHNQAVDICSSWSVSKNRISWLLVPVWLLYGYIYIRMLWDVSFV